MTRFTRQPAGADRALTAPRERRSEHNPPVLDDGPLPGQVHRRARNGRARELQEALDLVKAGESSRRAGLERDPGHTRGQRPRQRCERPRIHADDAGPVVCRP